MDSFARVVMVAEVMTAASIGYTAPSEPRGVSSYLQNALAASVDPDCRTFEVNLEEYEGLSRKMRKSVSKNAFKVFDKCRLLVLRNAVPPEVVLKLQTNFTQYLKLLSNTSNEETVAHTCRTTWGESFCLHSIGDDRWEVLLSNEWTPKAFLHPVVQIILRRALGEDYSVHSIGAAVSEPKTPEGHWHMDQSPIFGDNSYANHGFGGHDIPSTAITLIAPLADMTPEFGPTEFCIGSSYLAGVNLKPESLEDITQPELISILMKKEYQEYLDLTTVDETSCPPSHIRTPILSLGDLVLFDYGLTHRGGRNDSPYTRPLLYYTFSRSWFRDGNFRKERMNRMETTRYALLDGQPIRNEQTANAKDEISRFVRNQPWRHMPNRNLNPGAGAHRRDRPVESITQDEL